MGRFRDDPGHFVTTGADLEASKQFLPPLEAEYTDMPSQSSSSSFSRHQGIKYTMIPPRQDSTIVRKYRYMPTHSTINGLSARPCSSDGCCISD